MSIHAALMILAMQSLTSPTVNRWVTVQTNDAGEAAVDPQSIRRSGNTVEVTVRARIAGSGGEEPIVGVMRYAYHCTARTYRVSTLDFYDADNRFTGSTAGPNTEQAIEDGSPNDATIAHVCRR